MVKLSLWIYSWGMLSFQGRSVAQKRCKHFWRQTTCTWGARSSWLWGWVSKLLEPILFKLIWGLAANCKETGSKNYSHWYMTWTGRIRYLIGFAFILCLQRLSLRETLPAVWACRNFYPAGLSFRFFISHCQDSRDAEDLGQVKDGIVSFFTLPAACNGLAPLWVSLGIWYKTISKDFSTIDLWFPFPGNFCALHMVASSHMYAI